MRGRHGCQGRLLSARLRAGHTAAVRSVGLPKVSSVSSFGEDAAGPVYVTSLDGPVYRLAGR
jgi:hypothetical protein